MAEDSDPETLGGAPSAWWEQHMTARTAERAAPAYEACLYHDSETDAAVSDTFIGYFPTLAAATRAINARRNDHWQTGGIRFGSLYPAVFGESPEWFDADDSGSWFVGIDGKADR